jgi:hypothetical protein
MELQLGANRAKTNASSFLEVFLLHRLLHFEWLSILNVGDMPTLDIY